MTPSDWTQMSLAVGRVHTELAIEFPLWARNLEHLPGVNLTVAEMIHPLLYYPEFAQWTFHEGDPLAIEQINAALMQRRWNASAELYHLKRIATFFGPYVRGIDPPVNIGPWENKYPLHSRFMHYFAPPVQAMVSLALGRTIPGKLQSLRLAVEHLPNSRVVERVFDVLERHYECPELYVEPQLTKLERELEHYLSAAWTSLESKVTLIEVNGADTRQSIQNKIAALPINPFDLFFSVAKFGRLMKGRLLFYASDIAWFETEFLIANELGRIVGNFYKMPLLAYGVERFGERLEPDQVLGRLRGSLLTDEEVSGMKRFAVVAGTPLKTGQHKQLARAVAEIYDPVLSSLEKLAADMLRRAECRQQS